MTPKPRLNRLFPAVCLAAAAALSAAGAIAGPYIPPGDLALRHDIQRLADYGIIKSPVTTWPLAWGPILDDINEAGAISLPPAVADALARIRQRAGWETRVSELSFNAKVGVADNASRIRSFQETPRGRGEISAGMSWIDDWFSADVNVQYVDDTVDDAEIRADNSLVGVVVGNWSVAASTMSRWWGPGWDGSLILSNNARPVPAVTIDRVFTQPFETRWLSWLGPWDLNVIFGRLERDREVPNAHFFGMRFNFRPIPSLELGLSRGAQWCGDGRPCDASTFAKLLIGRDNRDTGGLTRQTEPGNQLAGVDMRWTPGYFDLPISLYGQIIGEDEAGGLPSRFIGQFGVEWSGYVFDRWSSRVYAEFAGTAAQFHEASKFFNFAYNHGIYRTGYRFRDRPIGHGADNDAEIFSAGALLVDSGDQQWRALIRFGELNAGGDPDVRNTLTPTPVDLFSVDIAHSRAFWFGVLEAGLGFESTDDSVAGSSETDTRIYFQWRSSY